MDTVNEERPYIVWDTCQIYTDEIEYQKERAKEEGEEISDEEAERLAADSWIYDDEWETVCEDLTEVMKEYNEGSDWAATVENFGWRGLDGRKVFRAESGRDFLEEILPKTDCTFKIFKRDGHIAIQNFHHDSPCGNEWYYIYPTVICSCCDNEAIVCDLEYEEALCQYHWDEAVYRMERDERRYG